MAKSIDKTFAERSRISREIALVLDPNTGKVDIDLENGDLVTEDTIKTYVYISVMTDRRADPDDEIPDGTDNPRGWWGDNFTELVGHQIGSKLWLRKRLKLIQEHINLIKDDIKECLRWMVQIKLAKEILIEAEKVDYQTLEVTIDVVLNSGKKIPIQFKIPWGEK